LRLTTSVEFANPQSTGKTITNYEAHIFHIGTSSVRSDSQSGILIEWLLKILNLLSIKCQTYFKTY